MLSKKQIGNNLRTFAEKKFKSLTDLADKLGMSLQAFRTYYDGDSVPGGRILAKLSELGCDINWLLNGDDQSPAVVRESNVDYKLITEVEALSKELAKLKEEVTALKEMHGDQALLIHSLKKENESLAEENRVLRVQSESITAAHVKIDLEKNAKIKTK